MKFWYSFYWKKFNFILTRSVILHMAVVILGRYANRLNIRIYSLTQLYIYNVLATCFDVYFDRHKLIVYNFKKKVKSRYKNARFLYEISQLQIIQYSCRSLLISSWKLLCVVLCKISVSYRSTMCIVTGRLYQYTPDYHYKKIILTFLGQEKRKKHPKVLHT
jgi:hypothetical protein